MYLEKYFGFYSKITFISMHFSVLTYLAPVHCLHLYLQKKNPILFSAVMFDFPLTQVVFSCVELGIWRPVLLVTTGCCGWCFRWDLSYSQRHCSRMIGLQDSRTLKLKEESAWKKLKFLAHERLWRSFFTNCPGKASLVCCHLLVHILERMQHQCYSAEEQAWNTI